MPSSSNLDQDIVRESLECPICKDFFVEPKQLLCGHTFCQGCIDGLERIVSSAFGDNNFLSTIYPRSSEARRCVDQRMNDYQRYSIMCPNCRKLSLIPEDGLNTNYVVKEMVEKFRFICVSNGESFISNNDSVDKSLCTGCNRQTPKNELFFCKGCALNNNTKKKLICSLCVIKMHKEHDVIMFSDFASTKDREEAANLITDAACRARSFVEKMKTIRTNFNQGFDSIEQKLKYSLEPFEVFYVQCYDNESNLLKEELEEKVRKAKHLSDRFSMTYTELEKINQDTTRFFRSINSMPGFDNPKCPRFLSYFVTDCESGPSTSSNNLTPFHVLSNSFAYNSEKDRLHKRKNKHRRNLNIADPRIATNASDDSSVIEIFTGVDLH